MDRRSFLRLGALLGPLAAAGLAPARAARAASGSLSPSPVAPGATLQVTVAGFRPGERIDRWVTAPNNVSTSIDPYIYADPQGGASWAYSVPADAPAGQYTMAARGIKSNERIGMPFEVLPGAVSPETPFSVTPAAGPPGTLFRFNAIGFRADERVFVWANGPNDENVPGPFGLRSDDEGAAAWEWAAPADAARGAWRMVALGNESRVQHLIPFVIA